PFGIHGSRLAVTVRDQLLTSQLLCGIVECASKLYDPNPDEHPPDARSPPMTDLSALTPGTWTVDPAHSTVGFVARHLMITKVRGRFTDFSGSLEIASDPLQSHVVATVNLASVDTGHAAR